jgi:hypothetical protein
MTNNSNAPICPFGYYCGYGYFPSSTFRRAPMVPWPLHNRYTRTDTCVRVRWGMAVTYNRYKFVTVSLPERFRNGRFTSETAVRFQKRNGHWTQKYLKKSVGTSRKL